jgi:MOSC domain-containing protein YiiM
MKKTFKIISINVSDKKGVKKVPVKSAMFIEEMGIENDAHAAPGDRQVSLLAIEDIDTMRNKGIELKNGDFAENLTTKGVDLPSLPIGTDLTVGEVVLQVSKIGKECHHGCAIKQQVGDCVMPRRGIFARVIKGGVITNESTGTYSF